MDSSNSSEFLESSASFENFESIKDISGLDGSFTESEKEAAANPHKMNNSIWKVDFGF